MKIVSLLPSATEIVCAVGMGEHLVGVSHSCDYPERVGRLPAMTSTRVPYMEESGIIDEFVRNHLNENTALYDLNLAALAKAAPDIIVSQALCDVCAVSTGDVLVALDALPSKPRLVDLEPNTLEDVLVDCKRVAEQLGRTRSGEILYDQLNSRRKAVADRTAAIPTSQRPRVAFLEWLEPPFNGGHWNPELVELAGGIDVLGATGKPSSTLSWEQVIAAAPDILFIACCGFSAARALEDIDQLRENEHWQELLAVVDGNVLVADGNNFFSRPGPRLLDGLEIMAHAMHPDIHPVSSYGSCIRPS